MVLLAGELSRGQALIATITIPMSLGAQRLLLLLGIEGCT